MSLARDTDEGGAVGPVFALPQFGARQDALWDTILDLSVLLDDGTWVLAGGQAVVAHGLAHRVPTDVLGTSGDPVGVMVVIASALPTVKRSFTYLGFHPDAASGTTIGFRRDADGADAAVQSWRIHVIGRTHLAGGNQALARRMPYRVTKGMRSPLVPVPDLLSTIVYEASQFAAEPTAALSHARAIVFLVPLLDDIEHQRERLSVEDRRALLILDQAIHDPGHEVWGDADGTGSARAGALRAWRHLLSV